MATDKNEVFEAGRSGLFLFKAVETHEDHRLSDALKKLSKTSLVGQHAYITQAYQMQVEILPDFRDQLDDAGFSKDDKHEFANQLTSAVLAEVDTSFPGLSREDLHRLRVNRRTSLHAVGQARNVLGLRFEPSSHIQTVQRVAAAFLADYVDVSSWNTTKWLPVSPIAETCGMQWAINKIQTDPRGALPSAIELPNMVTFAGLATNIVDGSDATGFHLSYIGR